jgi:hypothetical protein
VPPPERLRGWLAALFAAKRRKALDDPELFATYATLVAGSSTLVDEHIGHLTDQLAAIITDGTGGGDFATGGAPRALARTVLTATPRVHDPVHAASWADPRADADLTAVTDLILNGLRRRP